MPWDLTGNAIASGDFLGTINGQPLAIRVNNMEAMRIDPNGNVGIGTTSPLHTLQVGGGFDGNLGLDGSDGTPNAGYMRFGDNTGWQFHITRQREMSAGPLNAGTTGALVTFQDNGNVGIGTTSPLHTLQVGGGFDGNLGLDGSDGTPNAGYMRFGDNTGWQFHITRQREMSAGPLNAGTTGALVTFQDNGNVGIGTAAPDKTLHVAGDARIDGVSWLDDVYFNVGACNDFTIFGNLNVQFWVRAALKLFTIDHPLDPANKYLNHASVESPDLKTFYDGIAELDGVGEAVVELPEWFEALNKDFRYQLTGIGGFAPVYIAEEITNNRFKIAGGNPGMKVCWQVTGVRHDAVARATPMVVEEDKPDYEKGYYQNPEAHGQPKEMGIRWKRDTERRRLQEERP